MAYPVTFFLPVVDEVAFVLENEYTLNDDLSYFSEAFQTRRRNWIVRTYLNLRAAGYPVSLSAHAPSEGIVVVMATDRDKLSAQLDRSGADVVPVVVRADLIYLPGGFFEIVQNGCYADDKRAFCVWHWPQPGLIPRDASRGSRIETVAFFGYGGNLHPYYRAKEWRDAMEKRGLRWELSRERRTDEGRSFEWTNYREVDLVLAVRPDLTSLCENKPASKLVNAWLAEVPALLGPEAAYRELRQSPLDYVEITRPEDALEAIDRLRANPAEYQARIEHGQTRAPAFTEGHVTSRWADVLYQELPARIDALGGPARARSRMGGLKLSLTSPAFAKEMRDKASRLVRRVVRRSGVNLTP